MKCQLHSRKSTQLTVGTKTKKVQFISKAALTQPFSQPDSFRKTSNMLSYGNIPNAFNMINNNNSHPSGKFTSTVARLTETLFKGWLLLSMLSVLPLFYYAYYSVTTAYMLLTPGNLPVYPGLSLQEDLLIALLRDSTFVTGIYILANYLFFKLMFVVEFNARYSLSYSYRFKDAEPELIQVSP